MHAQLQDSKGILLLIVVSLLFACSIPTSIFAQAQAQPATTCFNGRLIDADGNDYGECSNTTALTRGGVFGCTGRGATVSNVGLTAIQGGIYVPVNDSAVTLNTGYLVYKECVLDAVVKRAAENATAQTATQGIRSISTGRNGEPQFSTNRSDESYNENVLILAQIVDENNTSVICPAFKNTVKSAVVRSFAVAHNRPNQSFTCSAPSSGSVWQRLEALQQPQNNSYGAYLAISSQYGAVSSYNELDQRQRLQRNHGFYDQLDISGDPLRARIVSPGYVISQTFQQMLGSGFRQLENANEIDQIVSNLWSGIGAQILGGSGGIPGLMQASGGTPSYLSRMNAETAQGVRDQAINAAIAVLNGALSAERLYKSAKEAIANAIINAIGRLRAAETQCWALIVPKVQEKAAADGASLTIATSTDASQGIISGQIAPIASSTSNDIRSSENALEALTAIATILVSSTNATAQQQALLQLEALLTAGRIHTQQDAQAAVSQRDSVLSALNVLVEDTITAWGDSTDPNIGWCNVNNEAVIERWYTAWRI